MMCNYCEIVIKTRMKLAVTLAVFKMFENVKHLGGYGAI